MKMCIANFVTLSLLLTFSTAAVAEVNRAGVHMGTVSGNGSLVVTKSLAIIDDLDDPNDIIGNVSGQSGNYIAVDNSPSNLGRLNGTSELQLKNTTSSPITAGSVSLIIKAFGDVIDTEESASSTITLGGFSSTGSAPNGTTLEYSNPVTATFMVGTVAAGGTFTKSGTWSITIN